MKIYKYVFTVAIIFLYSSCATKQYREIWFSEDGKYEYKNSLINVATFETFRPLQQYHDKKISSIEQDGMLLIFKIENAPGLTIKANNIIFHPKPTINGTILRSRKTSKENKENTIKIGDSNSSNNTGVREKSTAPQKKGLFSKSKNSKASAKEKAFTKEKVKSENIDIKQFENKTIEWIVILEHGLFIKFTDRTRFHISADNVCINNIKYQFTNCYYY
ncbi:hypothetical protein EZS27_005014 [termite gut metagenome]|uniref:Uncharacterized protein n=1 Tax=termite gut metagenome TaxID=433724 RepID=A0A5J4SN08_9ZZZZ